MSACAMATTGAEPANHDAPAAVADHCAHVSAFRRNAHLQRLMVLRDEFVRIATNGRYVDAASREWRSLPANWRMSLAMMAGIGLDVDNLATLAGRDWQEMPPAEREALQVVVRSAKRHLGRLTALAARV